MTERRRILIVAPEHHVYDERVLRTVAAASAEYQCFYAIDRERLAEVERDQPDFLSEMRSRIGSRVEIHLLPPGHKLRFVYRFLRHLYALRIAALARRLRPDLVHIHDSGTLGLLIAYWVRRLSPRATVVFDYHDWIPYEVALSCRNDPRLYRRVLPLVLRFYRRVAASVDTAVCISEGQAAWTRAVLGIEQTRVVPNVRPPRTPPDLSGAPVRPQLLFVGHVMRIRRIEFLIDVLAELRAHSLDARLVICGHVTEPGYAAELTMHAEARGVREHVVFHGRFRDDEDLVPLLTRGSVGTLLAHPQVVDTGILAISSANKFFSYMALGLPALLEAGFDEMIRVLDERGAGYAFSSVAECVARARAIFETQGLWEQMSRSALSVAQEMNSETYSRELLELYAP